MRSSIGLQAHFISTTTSTSLFACAKYSSTFNVVANKWSQGGKPKQRA
jgi:hypothetical protein